MLWLPLALGFAIPSIAVVAIVRWCAARALGMKGIRLLFGGAIANREAAAAWRRAAVVVVSAAASYLVPVVPFAVSGLQNGRVVTSTEIDVIPGRPAEAAGLASGDRVVSVAGEPVATWEAMAAAIAAHAEPIEIVVARNGAEARFTVTPAGPAGQAKIGVKARLKREALGLGPAIAWGLGQPVRTIGDSLGALREPASGELMGPVAIVAETKAASARGVDLLSMLAALLSQGWPIAAVVAALGVPRRERDRSVPS